MQWFECPRAGSGAGRRWQRDDLWTIEDIGNFPFVQLAWDPQGAYLFFTVTGAGTTELRRLDMETRTVQTLLSYEGDPQPMVVTP